MFGRKPHELVIRHVGLSGWFLPPGAISWGGSWLKWDTSYLYWN